MLGFVGLGLFRDRVSLCGPGWLTLGHSCFSLPGIGIIGMHHHSQCGFQVILRSSGLAVNVLTLSHLTSPGCCLQHSSHCSSNTLLHRFPLKEAWLLFAAQSRPVNCVAPQGTSLQPSSFPTSSHSDYNLSGFFTHVPKVRPYDCIPPC